MWLLVGLGNPGSEYTGNRHNIGFMAVDAIARIHGLSSGKAKFQGRLAEGYIGPHRVLALKPDTYMNLSGQSVAEAARFHKIDPSQIIVFHDDLDLAPGKVRTKLGGGHGGHNGLRSIDSHIGQAYHRLRMGIGHPGDKALVHGYVLHDFSGDDRKWLTPLLDAVGQHAGLLLENNEAGFMNKVALAVNPPEPKPAKAEK